MEITATQRFRHDGDTYEAGGTYDVDDALAGYFVGNGWATAEGLEPGLAAADAVVDLQPDSARHDSTSEGP